MRRRLSLSEERSRRKVAVTLRPTCRNCANRRCAHFSDVVYTNPCRGWEPREGLMEEKIASRDMIEKEKDNGA